VNKMSRSTTNTEMEDEWSRISLNPDNVIVSDVLRDTLAEHYSETHTKSKRLNVVLSTQSNDLSVLMQLLRIEQSQRGWAVVCTCPSQTALSVIRQERDVWEKLVLKIGNELIRELEIDTSKLRIEVDVTPTNHNECTVIVSCSSEQSSNT